MSFERDYLADEPTRAEVDRLPGAVLAEFGAPWCPFCQPIQPELAALLSERPEVKHLKIEDGKGKPLGRSFQVKLWPNLVLLKDGRVLRQLARPDLPQVRQTVEQLFPRSEG